MHATRTSKLEATWHAINFSKLYYIRSDVKMPVTQLNVFQLLKDKSVTTVGLKLALILLGGTFTLI